MLQVKVVHKNGEAPTAFYNAVRVEDCFDDNGNLCHRVVERDGDTATFPACEWKFYSLEWVEMF